MKIVHVISNLGKGGAERLVVDLCNSFSEDENNEVCLCVFYEKDNMPTFKNELSPKVKYSNLNKEGRISLSFQFKLFSFLVKHKPDVVNSHLSGTALYLYLPVLYFKKIKFFHTIHNLAHEETPNKTLQKIRKFIYNTKRFIPVSISKITQISHLKLYNIDSELIYNGVKKQEPTKDFESVQQEIAAYKKDDYTKVFLSVGRINSPKDQKNYKLLVNVFTKLQTNNINAVLIIIGADNSAEKTTLNELKKLNTGNVFFAGPKNNISDYMLNADVYCLSSIFEGLPITILEALSQGLPVISTNVGGISELIIDNENGLLVNDLNVDTYYNKVVELLGWNEEKIKSTKAINEKKYFEQFNISSTSANYLQMYLKYNKH